MQYFTVQGTLPGLNDIIAMAHNRRGKFSPYAQTKKQCETKIKAAIREAKIEPVTGPVEIYATWYESHRRRDPDNIRAGIKYILDAMVDEGIIEGDSQKYITEISDGFRVDKDNPRVEVAVCLA